MFKVKLKGKNEVEVIKKLLDLEYSFFKEKNYLIVSIQDDKQFFEFLDLDV